MQDRVLLVQLMLNLISLITPFIFRWYKCISSNCNYIFSLQLVTLYKIYAVPMSEIHMQICFRSASIILPVIVRNKIVHGLIALLVFQDSAKINNNQFAVSEYSSKIRPKSASNCICELISLS